MVEVLNMDTIAQLSALGSAALGEIVECYAQDARRRLEALATLESDRAEQILDHLHTLKGASLTLGAQGVAERCAEGERVAARGDWDALRGPIRAELEAVLEVAVSVLRGMVETLET